MCCFSIPINNVSSTNIFARMTEPGKQLVVYNMALDSSKKVSMILPIPVQPGTPENGVQFLDLSNYPTFFDDMNNGFPPPPPPKASSGYGAKAPVAAPQLEVKKVGSYDASFVPTMADFSRLSSKFRLPAGTWEALPRYANHGFAVFKLRAGNAIVHPMAFEFPTVLAGRLFFPTVHIHDGLVHDDAFFDHKLYCQVHSSTKSLAHWLESPGLAQSFVNVAETKGIVMGKNHVYLKQMTGTLKNRDTVVALV